MVQTLKKWRKFQKPAHFHNHLSSRNYINWRLWSHTEVFSSCRERGYILGLFAPISIISQTQAKALTSTRGRAANPQLHRRGGESRSVSLRRSSIYSFRSREVPAQLPGLCPRRSWSIFSLICHRLRLGQRVAVDGGDTSVFHNFLFFFFNRHRTAFCPTVLLFNLREKRVLVLITWLQFTWDRKKKKKKKTKGAKKGGEPGEWKRQHRDSLVVRIPLSQSAFMDNEKKWWFLDWGPVCRMAGIQGVIVARNSAGGCIRAASYVPSPSLLSAYQHCLVWNARSLSVRGADAIMKSTRDAAQTARALKLALTPVTQSG